MAEKLLFVEIALLNYFRNEVILMKNFIFIGDSLTFGYGINKNKSWLQKLSNDNFIKKNNFNISNKYDVLFTCGMWEQ